MPKESYKTEDEKLVPKTHKYRPEQIEILKILSSETGTTVSELIRSAIDRALINPYKEKINK